MRLARITLLMASLLMAFCARAQTNGSPSDNAALVQKEIAATGLKEQMRSRCIEGRRSICGKVIQISPEGLLVESGYTNLLRQPLTKSWLVPAAVTASLAPNPVESTEPGAICFGTVFLTDLPRGKPHLYDYVILAGYPTGEMAYTVVGIKKTARRFSANLDKTVNANLAGTAQPSSSKTK